MTHKPQSEEIPKEELPHSLSNFSIMRRFALLSPDGFLEGDTFSWMLMQACMYMCVCLKTFFCRHSLSTKDTHKLGFIKAVSTKNFQHVEVLSFLLSRRLSLWVKLGIIELKPSIHLREKKTFVYTETCTVMFIAVLFTLTKRWKQPKYPSPDKWINIDRKSVV